MNSQPASTYPNSYPDARIDQVLDALRTTEPPTGLEQRIAARLAQAAEARTLKTPPTTASSFLAVILNAVKDPRILLEPATLYSAAALTVVIALTTLAVVYHRTPATTARATPIVITPTSISRLEAAGLPSRHTAPATNPALAEQASSPLPPSAQDLPLSAQDPEAIALAETLAPSRPAPPMPLTAQEKLIQAATRPGQPIQLAELDLARAPILRAAAEAREHASIESYVKTLLAPFALADALQPITASQPQETPTTPPAEPTSNPTN